MVIFPLQEEEDAPNIIFKKGDKNEVCPNKPTPIQKPRISGRNMERKRFKPPVSPPIVGSTAKLITGHKGQAGTNTNEAIDVCFRVNGSLMSLPQSSVEEKIMDKVLWNFMMKKAASNVSKLIEEKQLFGYL